MTDSFSAQRRDGLLDALYLAPFESGGWQAFLQGLVQWSGSRSARLLVLDNSSRQVLSSVQVNTDAGAHQAYVEHFVNLCPWRTELGSKLPGRLYSTYLDFSCDQRRFYRSEFFNDWARPLDIHHGACGTVWQHQDMVVQLLVQRTEGQGFYDPAAMQHINALLPHVQRALRLEWHQQQQLNMADACRHPVLVLDSDGLLCHVSPQAEQLLATSAGVHVHQQRLQLSLPACQRQLERAIQSLLQNPWRHAGDTITIPRPSQPPLRMLLMPLHPDAAGTGLLPPRARILIHLVDGLNGTEIDEAVLASLFAMTPAETRVAALVAQGRSPAEIATLCHLSVHTVRSQLKTLFRKTDTASQSQLACAILNSPARRQASVEQPLSLSGHPAA